MKKDKRGFSIVLAIGVVILMTLTAFYILELIIPFSKNTKGIENASNAYYQAYSGIEYAMWLVKRNDAGFESGSSLNVNKPIDMGYKISAMTNTIPKAGEGNSEFDNNWSKIGRNNPVQLALYNGNKANPWINVDWNNLKLEVRVPMINGVRGTLSGSTNTPIIHWSLNHSENSLNSSGSQIKVSDINGITPIKFKTLVGKDLEGNGNLSLWDFRDSLTRSGIPIKDRKATLKLSLINELVLKDNGQKIPYLEYRLTTGNVKLPSQYSKIKSEGKSYGYKKVINMGVPQMTTNQAFDFTVFQ